MHRADEPRPSRAAALGRDVSLNPYTSHALSGLPGIRHGFFTREGGVSTGISASLNAGQGSRDDPAAVAENRARIAHALGARPDGLLSAFQTHSTVAATAEAPWTRAQSPQADAMVTRVPGLALGVLTADCVPALLCDSEAGVIGAAHAGWKGAIGGILDATVAAMEKLGARRDRIVAAIGPCISASAYEVGHDRKAEIIAMDSETERYFADGGARPHFNLPGYAAERLRALSLAQVDDLGICTFANEVRLFSYRRTTHRQEADYGRQISAIVLEST